MNNVNTKICKKCNLEKNILFYKIQNYSKKIYDNLCIDCSNEIKECIECKKIKKLYDFKLINKYKKIYHSLCCNCFDIFITKQKNEKVKIKKEKEKIRMKLNYEKNKEKILERNKKWRNNNKEYRSIKDKE